LSESRSYGPHDTEADDSEAAFGPSTDLIRAVSEALAEDNHAEVETLVLPLHPADMADLLEQLSPEERRKFIAIASSSSRRH
jgi:magnesium transporter